MKPCTNRRKQIAGLAMNALDDGSTRELHAHLESCAGCRRYLAEMSQLTEQLAAAAPDTDLRATESFHQSVMAGLDKETVTSPWESVMARLREVPLKWRVASPVAVVALVLLGIWIESELGETGGLNWRVRRGAFLAGVGCLVVSALVAPQHVHTVMGLRHAHELLARTAAVCLGVGMLCACRDVGRITGEGRRGRQLRILRVAWWVATVPPMAGAVGSGLVVGMTRLLGSGAAAGYLGFFKGTVFWHLAFWEWMGSGAVFLFFASGAIILREVKS